MRYSLALVLLLSACATATPLPPIKGKSAYLVECNGTGQTVSACYQKASELCKNDYTIMGKERLNSGNVVGGQSTSSGMATPMMANVNSQASVFGTPYIERNLIIACN